MPELQQIEKIRGSKPLRVLDLFCGAGGAGMGYHLAGYEVVGVDIKPQKNYPFAFIQADALTFPVEDFDLIHASPPCQAYTSLKVWSTKRHPELVEPVREKLQQSGKPYVIENVPGAPLIDPIILCGMMFNLMVYRHRLFEISPKIILSPPPHPTRPLKTVRPVKEGEIITVVGHFSDVASARKAMGIDWMTRDELSQAIPPAYTRWIGERVLIPMR